MRKTSKPQQQKYEKVDKHQAHPLIHDTSLLKKMSLKYSIYNFRRWLIR